MQNAAASTGSAVASRSKLPGSLASLIFVLIGASMFTGIPGVPALGELSGDAAFYVSLAIVPFGLFAVFVRPGLVSGSAFSFAGLMIIATVISILINYSEVSTNEFLGRSGFSKAVTSSMVLFYYVVFFISIFSIIKLYGVVAVFREMSSAAEFWAIPLIVIIIIQIAGWFYRPILDVLGSVQPFWSTGFRYLMFRFSGFALEPSHQAIVTTGFLTLLGWRYVMLRAVAAARARYTLCLFVILLALQFFGGARTFVAVVAGVILFTVMWRLVPSRVICVAFLVVMPIAMTIVQVSLSAAYSSRREFYANLSNVTRSANIQAAIDMWQRQPLFGNGMGQYGFLYRGSVPTYARHSWEVDHYVSGKLHDYLMPSYNLYTRILAELGLFGLLAWLLAPAIALWIIFGARRHKSQRARAFVLGVGIVATLAIGVSVDSFRFAFFWVFLAGGLALSGGLAPKRYAHSGNKSQILGGVDARSDTVNSAPSVFSRGNCSFWSRYSRG